MKPLFTSTIKRMYFQRNLKFLPLFGFFVFMILLFYLFSIILKSKLHLPKLPDVQDEIYGQDHPGNLLQSQKLVHSPGSQAKNIRMGQPGFFQSFFKQTAFDHRIVHLDLKGAPPKVEYLITLLPLLKTLGATGVLIEYEDMFPYKNEIENLSAYNAYKPSEITNFLKVAKENNLEVIPLVQTFGHMEFALKLKEFVNLREVPASPQVMCPLRNGSFALIKAMLDQVISHHPNLNWIHIGSDEVYNIGECNICREYSIKNKLSKDDLFVKHAFNVAKYIKDKYKIQPIMWDDEFRKIPLNIISKSKVQDYVEIMVWKYSPGILRDLGSDLWSKYSELFDGIWVASAFKGASAPDSLLTDINQRLSNNKEWVEVAELYKSSINFKGIALTGWQRFDHFAVLCELLPQAIPVLAASLAYILNKRDDHEILSSVADSLNCNNYFNLDVNDLDIVNTCHYPGSKIYELSQELFIFKKRVDAMMGNSHIRGWITEYNIKNNFASPQMVELGFQELSVLLFEYKKMYNNARLWLSDVYDEHTINEWIALNLDPDARKLDELYQARRSLTATSWPRRPLDMKANKDL